MLQYLIEKLVLSSYHLIVFKLQSLFCLLSITICPFGCHLSLSIVGYLNLYLFCCSNLFSPVYKDLHHSKNFIYLLFS